MGARSGHAREVRTLRPWLTESGALLRAAWVEEMISLLRADGEMELCALLTTERGLEVRSWTERGHAISELHTPGCGCGGRGRPWASAGFGHTLDALACAEGEGRVGECVDAGGVEAWRSAHLERFGVPPDEAAAECAALRVRGEQLSPWTVQAACAEGELHPRVATARGWLRAQVRARLRQIPAGALGGVLAALYELGGEDEGWGRGGIPGVRIHRWTGILTEACAQGRGQACSGGCEEVLVVVAAEEYDAPWYASNVLRLWMEEIGLAGSRAVGVVCEHAWASVEAAGVEVSSLAAGFRAAELPGGIPEGAVLECFARLLAEAGRLSRDEVRAIAGAAADALAM